MITKTELVKKMAERSGLQQTQCNAALNAFIDEVYEAVANKEKLAIQGFGSFETSERAAREGRNPRTGETVQIAASTQPKFKPGADMKAAANKNN